MSHGGILLRVSFEGRGEPDVAAASPDRPGLRCPRRQPYPGRRRGLVQCDALGAHRDALAPAVGRQTIENAIERLQTTPDPSRALEDLVTSFAGNRQLRVRIIGDPMVRPISNARSPRRSSSPVWSWGLLDLCDNRLGSSSAVIAKGEWSHCACSRGNLQILFIPLEPGL